MRFVERLYDWGIRSTDEKDALNTREQVRCGVPCSGAVLDACCVWHDVLTCHAGSMCHCHISRTCACCLPM